MTGSGPTAGEGPCRDYAAGVEQTAVVGARLIALGHIDPGELEVSGADHDLVAVDHRGLSDEASGLVLAVGCSIVASAASENKQGGGKGGWSWGSPPPRVCDK